MAADQRSPQEPETNSAESAAPSSSMETERAEPDEADTTESLDASQDEYSDDVSAVTVAQPGAAHAAAQQNQSEINAAIEAEAANQAAIDANEESASADAANSSAPVKGGKKSSAKAAGQINNSDESGTQSVVDTNAAAKPGEVVAESLKEVKVDAAVAELQDSNAQTAIEIDVDPDANSRIVTAADPNALTPAAQDADADIAVSEAVASTNQQADTAADPQGDANSRSTPSQPDEKASNQPTNGVRRAKGDPRVNPTIDSSAQVAQKQDISSAPLEQTATSPTVSLQDTVDNNTANETAPTLTPNDQTDTASSKSHSHAESQQETASAKAERASGDTTSKTNLSEADRVRFVQRVAKAFQNVGEAGGEIRLRLSPPELGALRLELRLQEGVMTASLETETAAAKNVLLENLPALRERLAEQNIKVERFDVEVRDQSRSPNNDQSWGQAEQQRPARQRNRPASPAATSAVTRPLETNPANRAALGNLNVIV